MSWMKKLIFMAVGIFISIALGIVLLELIFGSWNQQDEWSKTRALNIVRDVEINYKAEHIYGQKMPIVSYKRDKNGLRGSCTEPEKIDILTIGGSTTDQRLVPEGETFQDILQALMERNKYELCVANAGFDGHSTFAHIEAFRTWFPLINGLRPKYVLFYVGINDAPFRDRPDTGFYSENNWDPNESSIINSLRLNSAIYGLLRTFRNHFFGRESPTYFSSAGHSTAPPADVDYTAGDESNNLAEQIKANTERFEKRFKKLLSLSRAYGAKPICVSQPHLYTKNFNGHKKGLAVAFRYEGVEYNGLDFEASIAALNASMKALCLENDGFFIDIAAKKFIKDDS